MKIEYINSNNCLFGGIDIGDLFLNNKTCYMKVGKLGASNLAVNIANGRLKTFKSFAPVRPISGAKMVVNMDEEYVNE